MSDADKIPPIEIINGLATLAPSYEGFIIDLWGVIHDGIAVFEGVIACLHALRKAEKKVVFLSNAPRRSQTITEQLQILGIPDPLYRGIISSGQDAYHYLSGACQDSWYQSLGRICYHIGPERDETILTGLPLEIVETVTKADFILNTGPWRDEDRVAHYEDILQSGAQSGLPMICCNPDREVIRGGKKIICAGALAERYQELGGKLRYHGKPDAAIYIPCLARLGIKDRKRVLVIGDSLSTDIAGARAAGIESLLITGGLHKDDLETAGNPASFSVNKLEILCRKTGVFPVYAMPRFIWEETDSQNHL